jgi:hypothetical protein
MEPLERVIKDREVRKKLDKLLKNAKTVNDVNHVQFLVDDYIEEGYNVRSYIFKCNAVARKLNYKG